MTEQLKSIITSLIDAKALKDVMTTSQVVKFLDNSRYYRQKLHKPELREILGGRRVSSRGDIGFNTLKVIEFKIMISKIRR